MSNFEREISNYVASKRGSWSLTTCATVSPKLRTISEFGFNKPEALYDGLQQRGYSRYTIKTYFILAAAFEKSVKRTTKIQQWIEANRLRFKNSYKEKERRLNSLDFERLLKEASTDDLHNFLVLTGRFGLRKNEALNLKWENFVNGRLVLTGKGDKKRMLPKQFSQNLLRGQTSLGLIIRKPINLETFRPFTPHDFRHYAVTSWVNDDKLNIKEAALLAGHSNIETTSRYLRTDLTEIEEKLK